MRIDDLETNLARTPIIARKLKVECQAFKKVIDDAVNALNKPKEIDDKLKSLSSDLGALHSGLTVAKVVRPIRLVAGRLQSSVKSVKRSVDKAEAKAKALDEKAKPIREKLKALSKQVGQFVKELDKLITQSTAALAKIKKVHGCVNSLQNPLRTLGLAQLNDFARVSNPPVVQLNKNMTQVNDAIKKSKAQIRQIIAQLNKLKQILREIASLRKVINPIMAPLKALLRALNQKINLRMFSFSIRQILDGLKLPWPFSYLEKLFWSTANRILNPILKALKLDVKLPGIPGLNLLGKINLDAFDKMPDFAGMLDDLAGSFRNLSELLKLFKVSCPPRKSAPTTSEALASALKGARPKLVAA